MSITLLIVSFTVLVSFMAFNNRDLFLQLKHWPYQEARSGQYYRWLSSGFVHADPLHLIFNMLTLYIMAGDQDGSPGLESWFMDYFPQWGATLFLLFYLLSVVAASSATFYRYRHTPSFASIGASGAVAAVLFAEILLHPEGYASFMFFPVRVPAYLFGILYLWYSSYAARRGGDNIDHYAHFFGAVFGIFFMLALAPELASAFVRALLG